MDSHIGNTYSRQTELQNSSNKWPIQAKLPQPQAEQDPTKCSMKLGQCRGQMHWIGHEIHRQPKQAKLRDPWGRKRRMWKSLWAREEGAKRVWLGSGTWGPSRRRKLWLWSRWEELQCLWLGTLELSWPFLVWSRWWRWSWWWVWGKWAGHCWAGDGGCWKPCQENCGGRGGVHD